MAWVKVRVRHPSPAGERDAATRENDALVNTDNVLMATGKGVTAELRLVSGGDVQIVGDLDSFLKAVEEAARRQPMHVAGAGPRASS
jgi:hypothetical protein